MRVAVGAGATEGAVDVRADLVALLVVLEASEPMLDSSLCIVVVVLFARSSSSESTIAVRLVARRVRDAMVACDVCLSSIQDEKKNQRKSREKTL